MINVAIENAVSGKSFLTPEILSLPGYSPRRLRHLLNNLVQNGSTYLEVGLMWGASFVSALYGHTVKEAFGCENFSQFDATQESLCKNLRLVGASTLYTQDSFTVRLPATSNIDVYFYDGAHDEVSQCKALLQFYPWLSNEFIFIVDDWCWECTHVGTKKSLSMFTIVESFELLPDKENDPETWWNGVFVARLRK